MNVLQRLMKSETWTGHKLQGRMKINGLNISIENKKGSVRRGVDKDGHEWSVKMNYSYGRIRSSIGADGDLLDVYVGPDKNSRRVFVVHQNDPTTGKYDEDKVMLFFPTPEEAKKAYLSQYDRPGFFGEMDETDIDTFKEHALDKKNHGKKLVIRRAKNPELEVGIKVEMEHTDDPEEAKKIALDHLKENPKYYSKLLAAGLVDEKDALDEAKRQGLKKSNDPKKTVAIDFDGVINSYTSGWKGAGETDDPVRGAGEAINKMIDLGYNIVIYSTRASDPLGKKTIVKYLSDIGVEPEGIEVTDKKPIADAYLDDRAVTFDGDWDGALEKLKTFKPWMQKSREWQNHKYIKKIGNKYFYTEEEIRNFSLQKRSDGFYYMDETKITNDPEKARQFVEKVREHKPAERTVQVGEKVQIKTDHRGSIGRGVVGVVKEIGEDFARVMDAAGRVFRVPTDALVFARSMTIEFNELRKSDNGDNHLVTKKIIVRRKGTSYQLTTHVNPDKDNHSPEKKKIRYVVKKPAKPIVHSKGETDSEILSREIEGRENQPYGINFGKTPEALAKHGFPANLPLKMYSGAVRKVMDEKHDLTKDQVLAVQEALKKPVAVLQSATSADRLVFVTDVLDDEGRPIVCAIMPDGNFYGRQANIITSIYGRNNFASFMEHQKELVIESDKERLDGLLSSVGRKQYPGALTGEPSKDKYTDDGKIVKSVRYVVALLQKARKSPKLVPERRTITRDGKTFQTTLWVLPGESGPAQGGLDFEAEPERNVGEDLDGRLEIAFKQANPKTKEGFFNALAQQLGSDKELQDEFVRRFKINAALPLPERKAHIMDQLTDEFWKQKTAHKDRTEAYRRSNDDKKKTSTSRAIAEIEKMATEADDAMQEQIKQRDDSDKILPGEQMPRKDLEAFKRRMDKEKADRDEWHRTHKDPPKVVEPEWSTLEGQNVLRIEGSKFVAAPVTGKKNASRFVVFNIDERKELAQISNKEVNSWLRKQYENEKENEEEKPNKTRQKDAYEKERSRMSGKDTDATLARIRHDVMFRKPYVGKTGAKLMGYEWPNVEVEEVDKRGEVVIRRYSDWDAADINSMTGRKFVHKFIIEYPDGSGENLTAESAAVALGVTEAAARATARRMLEKEVQRAREEDEANKRFTEYMDGKWYETPSEVLEGSTAYFGSTKKYLKEWGKDNKEYKDKNGYLNVDYGWDRRGDVTYHPRKGYKETFSPRNTTESNLAAKEGMIYYRIKAKDLFDENGNPKEPERNKYENVGFYHLSEQE